jgi:acetate kinase
MNILVLNCGSSSLKYRLISMPTETELAGGEAQRVGPPTAEPSRIIHRAWNRPPQTRITPLRNHAEAFKHVMKLLTQTKEHAPDAVGHRIVHDGGLFMAHVALDDASIAKLETINDLAPLHNPPAVDLAKTCRTLYPHLSQIAVFDTVFHATIPDYASTYAIPSWITHDLGIRKFGFHGISHQYVATEAARLLGQQPLDTLNAVSCHLGSGGASLCAIVNGRSVDNTMGYSPLQGLIMSTRCGDLDPSITLRLMALSDGDYQSVEKLLNEKSGVLGLSGKSADIRDALSASTHADGNFSRSGLAAQIYLWRLKKYLGAYLAVVGHPASIIFTDTVGETVPAVRWAMCANMEDFGVVLDANRNDSQKTLPVDIAAPASAVRILVIATNEELSIARSAYSLLIHEPITTRNGASV